MNMKFALNKKEEGGWATILNTDFYLFYALVEQKLIYLLKQGTYLEICVLI